MRGTRPPERLLALWRAHQRAILEAAGGDPDEADREVDEVAFEVLRGLWTGRSRTWRRLGTTAGPETSTDDETRALVEHLIEGRISPFHALGNGRVVHETLDGEGQAWRMIVHTPRGHVTVLRVPEGGEDEGLEPVSAGEFLDGLLVAEHKVPREVVAQFEEAWRRRRSDN